MANEPQAQQAGPGTRTRWGTITGEHDARYWKARDRQGRSILIAKDLGHALSPRGANLDWMYRQLAELKRLLRAAGKDASQAERYWSQHPTVIRGKVEAELRARAGRRSARLAKSSGSTSNESQTSAPAGTPAWLRRLLSNRRPARVSAASNAGAESKVSAPDARRVRPGALARLTTAQRTALRQAVEARGGDFTAWQRQVRRNALLPAVRRALVRLRRPRVGHTG